MASSSPLLQTLRGAWRSAQESLLSSSTRVRQKTGVHLHRIRSYPMVERMALDGLSIDSAPFRAGGYKWKLFFYPNGYLRRSPDGRAYVNLMLTGDPWWRRAFYIDSSQATAVYKVSILDGDGNWVFVTEVGPRIFAAADYPSCSDAKDVAAVEELKSALRRREDDDLVIRCEVTVMDMERESRITSYLRQLAGIAE